MYYVYILECSDGSLYTGWTTDPQRRLKEHNGGRGAKCTRSRLPVIIRHLESFETKREAMQRESRIKKLSRGEKIRLLSNAPSVGVEAGGFRAFDEKAHIRA